MKFTSLEQALKTPLKVTELEIPISDFNDKVLLFPYLKELCVYFFGDFPSSEDVIRIISIPKLTDLHIHCECLNSLPKSFITKVIKDYTSILITPDWYGGRLDVKRASNNKKWPILDMSKVQFEGIPDHVGEYVDCLEIDINASILQQNILENLATLKSLIIHFKPSESQNKVPLVLRRFEKHAHKLKYTIERELGQLKILFDH